MMQDIQTVKARAVEHPIAFPLLRELSEIIGPRLTGSAQETRAGQWALGQMQRVGLTSVHAEMWDLHKGWHRGYAQGQLVKPFPLELTLTSYGWAGSTVRGGVEANVMKVDAGTVENEMRTNAGQWANKILLLTSKDPKHADLFKVAPQIPTLISVAIKAHALAIIEAEWRPGIVLPHTGP